MGGLRTWFSGFAWGLMIGGIAAGVGATLLFRPDVIERLRAERPLHALAPTAPGGPPPAAVPQAAAPQAAAPRAAAPQAPRPAADLAPFFVNTTTKEPLDKGFAPPRAFAPTDDLVIRGTNSTTQPVLLAVRIDDAASKNWMTNFNTDTNVAPGAFVMRVPLDNLPTPSGTQLDVNAIARFIVFTEQGQPPLAIASVAIERRAAAAPAGGGENVARDGQSWLKGARLTATQDFSPPLAFTPEQELVVTGTNTGSGPVTIYLRIDDVNSSNWYSRANASATFPPGPFVLRAPVSSWVTPSKARLDRTKVKRIVVSNGEGEGPIRIDALSVEAASPVPADALALRFAPNSEIQVPGFETVLPNDPRLSKPAGILIRTQNDPLLSSGLNQIETVTIPWTKSDVATVSLWTEDQGEWEYFPHSLNRTIIINGQTVLNQSLTPGEWVDQVYKRGLWKEAMIDGGPWEIYARDRAGLITATVPVIDGKIVVQLESDQPPNNGYLAAMVIEPGNSEAAVDAVEAWRRTRYLERWPVVDKPVDPALATGVTLRILPAGAPRSQHPFWDPALPFQANFRAPRGGVVSLDFLAFSDQDDLLPDVSVTAPDGITPLVRWGKWTYMRRGGGENSLSITADVLEGDLSHMRIVSGVPRRLNVTFTVPQTARGTLPVSLALDIAGVRVEARALVEVVPVTLPQADRPIGYYMAAPNWELWFPPTPDQVDRGMACDYAALRAFGITGISPELVAPTPDKLARYVQQMSLVRQAGFTAPYFDYTSVKYLQHGAGFSKIGPSIASAQRALAAAGVANPLWSIADEPEIGDATFRDMKGIRDAIKASAPDAAVAGQLNSTKQRSLVTLFDTALVNNGYGVSAANFQQMRAQKITPWMYNMPDFRAAAGFFLWRTGASGYLQWHGRAWTGDPRDPTDGRESDYAMLPLSGDRCQPAPTIDALVITTSEGIEDLRWLLWLDDRATGDSKARALKEAIAEAVPGDWDSFEKRPPSLTALRDRIIDFALAASGG
ncbi:hypothetical protein [Aquabacter spiritensis]|uniref:Glycoside hydrolase 123 C-terminal domain-containing protein n=1 Tax=Aquabacter spiritensis TaxID=933073 RepID=A0A4R3M4P4_9HYPH|nr:hypothetical protein [Aquabacter spiritensis]TCT08002.1 hypothetical protein EDC64_101521 [Aquabacter spiritensis]